MADERDIDRLLESVEAGADLEGWVDDDLVADELRVAEIARTRLVERLRATSAVVDVHVMTIGLVSGSLLEVVRDGIVVRTAQGADWLVPVEAITRVGGLGQARVPDERVSEASRALGMPSVLRRWASDRWPVVVRLRDGSAAGGSLARVGSDHVDLALHEPDEAPDADRVTTIPIAAVAAIVRR